MALQGGFRGAPGGEVSPGPQVLPALRCSAAPPFMGREGGGLEAAGLGLDLALILGDQLLHVVFYVRTRL